MTKDATRSSLELLYNISRELASTLDLRTILSRVLFLSIRNVGAERGALIVLDEQMKPVEGAIVYQDQLIPHTAERLQATLDQGLAGWTLRNRQGALVADTSKDERWLRRADDAMEQSGPKSAICVPLSARETLAGVLTIVHSEPGFFTEDHLSLLQTIADQASGAIYNARLYESLQSATRRYRELFDDSIDPILVTQPSGEILEANRQASRTSGYSLDELGEGNVFDLHEAHWDRMGERFELLDGDKVISYESTLRRKNADGLPVQVYVRKVLDGSGVAIQWTLRDISERKALASLQDDLMAMIYHDLRSPLANIVSSLDMIATLVPMEESSSLRSIYSIASRSTERMQRLISSLLDINRLEAGQPITNQQPADLHLMVMEAMESVQPVIDGKQQALSIAMPDDLPLVWVDSDMIRRVLINLLENAAKFTPMQGSIALGGSFNGDSITIWVQDSGPGIPNEAQEHIFDKFIRLQAERFPRGVGLGLAFCRLAVQAHGGKIWVESKEGSGSRFLFTLPVSMPL